MKDRTARSPTCWHSNATYDTTWRPTIATSTWQWNQAFFREHRRDFVLLLEDRHRRLIGFTWDRPHGGEFEGRFDGAYGWRDVTTLPA